MTINLQKVNDEVLFSPASPGKLFLHVSCDVSASVYLSACVGHDREPWKKAEPIELSLEGQTRARPMNHSMLDAYGRHLANTVE